MPLSYAELLERYNALVSEYDKLKEENAELRRRLEEYSEPAAIAVPEHSVEINSTTTGVNKYSRPEEKIALFRSLFRGRDDVFACRWESKTSGKSGYQPVCENEWADGLCDKKAYRCAQCPNRRLKHLTDRDIYGHLEGKDELCRDVVGIYPMLADETCLFVAADFDDGDFQSDALAYLNVCHKRNIPAHMERSRSGSGIHVWIFFDKPVSTRQARKLGTTILTKAMEQRPDLSFKSYDRLFPNQDNMPNGGFGNLIALPLQGRARRKDNSVFVDEHFQPYPDQWMYLDRIARVRADDLDEIILTLGGRSELGQLMSENDEKPWERKKLPTITKSDFPQMIKIIKSNMLYVPKGDISSAAANQIKRLAAFKNPEFYRAQAMRRPIYDIPRIICTAEIFDKYIALPRGCEQSLTELLDESGTQYEFEDKSNIGHSIAVQFIGSLRDEQQPAADAMLQYDNGVLSATTAFGKTVVAAYIISKRKVNTLVLVHTQALMHQWQKSLEQFLELDVSEPEHKGRGRRKAWSPIGLLGAQKNTLHGAVDVAVMQSLIDGDEIKELVRDYGMIIVDECHHISAVNFERILKYANAKYVYGLTATPTRQDGHHHIIFMQCGPIRYKVDAKTQAAKRSFEHFIIPRFTSFRSAVMHTNVIEYYKQLMDDAARNELIVSDVKEALLHDRTPLILTERRDHVEILADMLKAYCDNIIKLYGDMPSAQKRDTLSALESIQPEQKLVIIATGKYVGEGFDYPRLDTLFLAMPISWKGKVAQYAGRLHREYSGKSEVQIYDYVDIHVPALEKMYQRRLSGYAAIGYKAKTTPMTDITPELIYDVKSFYPVFSNDIRTAKREILIVSSFMRISRLKQMVKLFADAMLNGESVTVVTRPPEDYRSEKEQDTAKSNADYLREYGVNVMYRSGFHQKYAIIDQRIVWYGSVNLLSFGANDESVMRLDSIEIAGQLTDAALREKCDAK